MDGREEVHTHDLIRMHRRRGDVANRDRTCVRREDGPRCDGVYFAQHRMLHGEILEHGFDHEVDIRKAAVVDGAGHQRQGVVHLQSRELPPLHAFAQYLAHRAPAGRHAIERRVLDSHERARLHRHRSNAGPHEPGTEHTDLAYTQGIGGHALGESGVLLERRRCEEDRYQLAAHLTHGQVAEPARFLEKPGLLPVQKAGLDHLERRQRCGILPTRFLEHRGTRLPEHDRATECVVFEQHVPHPARARQKRRGLSTSQRVHAFGCDLVQNRRMHQFVHEPHLPRLSGPDVPAGQDHVERGL